MEDFWLQGIITIVVALIAAVPGLLAYKRGRKIDILDREQKLTGTAMDLAERLEERIEKLEFRNNELEQVIELSEEWQDNMKSQLRALNDDMHDLRTQNEELRAINDTLLSDNRKLLHDNQQLFRGILKLLKQIDDANMEPDWQPSNALKERYSNNSE